MGERISRREFLKIGAILAGGALLSGCLPENSQASLPPQGETPKEPTPTPTKTNTPEAAKTLTPTKVPTPAPTERPTLSPEELTKERMARWEGRLWTIGSSDSAGGREIDPYDEEMQIFKEEVTLMAEKSGVKAEAVEMLLIGNNADIKERKDGTIEQIAPTKFFGIMISGKEEASVFCFTKDASGMEMDSSCDWFKKGEIWGSEYGEYVVKSPDGTALESFIIKEGEEEFRVFKAVSDQFGVLSVKEQEVKGELEKDEAGEWVLEGEVKDKEREEAVTGILITGEKNGEIGTFFLECKTLSLERKLKEGILPETPDLVLGRIYLSQKEARLGYLDLKDGTWNGNSLYENIESILKENILETAPKVEGLKAVEKHGKVLYFAEAGNPYGLEEGEQAGELIEFKIGRSPGVSEPAEKEDTYGLVLSPKIVKKFYLETLGGTGDNWKMPFNFDPRGNEIEIVEGHINGFKGVSIKSLGGLELVCPYPGETVVKSYSSYGSRKMNFVGMFVTNENSPEDDINWAISIYYGEGNPTMDNYGRKLNYNEIVVGDVVGQLSSPPFVSGYTIEYLVGSLAGPRNFSFDNILKIDNAFVFMSK